MRTIPLSNGGEAIVDDDDFERLAAFKWSRHTLGYAYRIIRENSRYVGAVYMHREVLGNPAQTDHVNRNKLDNRKQNLRPADHSLNGLNRDPQANNTSGVRGVDFDKRRGKWAARIHVRGKTHYLGRFASKPDAVAARQAAESRFIPKVVA